MVHAGQKYLLRRVASPQRGGKIAAKWRSTTSPKVGLRPEGVTRSLFCPASFLVEN
jgi:hypothetical protein